MVGRLDLEPAGKDLVVVEQRLQLGDGVDVARQRHVGRAVDASDDDVAGRQAVEVRLHGRGAEATAIMAPFCATRLDSRPRW